MDEIRPPSSTPACTGRKVERRFGSRAIGGTTHRGRRTRSRLLAAVTAEVDAMAADGTRGPASRLVERLANRGVRVTEATLRSGDCREQLERVWDRRLPSVRSFGPTGGHDLRPVAELVEHVIDLEWRLGRTRADIAGEEYDRFSGPGRDARSRAACAKKDRDVSRRAALVKALLPKLAARGVFPDFVTVAAGLAKEGESLTPRTLRRNEAYWRPILEFNGTAPPVKPADPRRTDLMRRSAEELGATVYRLLREVATAEAAFRAELERTDTDGD